MYVYFYVLYADIYTFSVHMAVSIHGGVLFAGADSKSPTTRRLYGGPWFFETPIYTYKDPQDGSIEDHLSLGLYLRG